MPILESNRREWPSAESVVVRPIGVGDCINSPTFYALVRQESVAGRGATIRKGVGWCSRSVSAIEGTCTPPLPAPSGVVPDPMIFDLQVTVVGTNFKTPAGALWLGNAATWLGSGTKVEQTVFTWAPAFVITKNINWATRPANVWVYVVDKWGLVNANGFATTIEDPPPVVPAVTDVEPDPMIQGQDINVSGTNFGAVEGKLWIKDGATWAGAGATLQQLVDAWNDEAIDGGAVNWPIRPDNIWIYVEHDNGEVNPNGFAIPIWDPP